MLTLGIIDEGVGAFPMYYKLKQIARCNYVCLMLNESFPLNRLNKEQLYRVGRQAIQALEGMGCDAIVISSVTLSANCYKRFTSVSSVPLYCSEAPVLHASSYTASNVLVCGDSASGVGRFALPNVISCVMERFPELAESANEREIVCYIDECLQPYIGSFDCVALASSGMNMYKYCFGRVCPNVRVFDSLDGVARKIRKKYKKIVGDESVIKIFDQQARDITEKYGIFFE